MFYPKISRICINIKETNLDRAMRAQITAVLSDDLHRVVSICGFHC